MPEQPTHPFGEVSASLRSYEEFLEDIKTRIRSAQARAARTINAELIDVYWQIGKEILRRQAEEGSEVGRRTRGVVQPLSADLRAAFPEARGYSVQSLYRMRAVAIAWPEGLSRDVRDLPWSHMAILVAKAAPEGQTDVGRCGTNQLAKRINFFISQPQQAVQPMMFLPAMSTPIR